LHRYYVLPYYKKHIIIEPYIVILFHTSQQCVFFYRDLDHIHTLHIILCIGTSSVYNIHIDKHTYAVRTYILIHKGMGSFSISTLQFLMFQIYTHTIYLTNQLRNVDLTWMYVFKILIKIIKTILKKHYKTWLLEESLQRILYVTKQIEV